MTVKEVFEKDFANFEEIQEGNNIYEWAASYIFGLSTYDGKLDEHFVKIIIDVCKTIDTRNTFKMIEQSDMRYITYIIGCQLLKHKNWINWGTSIRGAWFDYGSCDAEPIYEGGGILPDVPFTKDNFAVLIEFIEEKAKEKEND
jgi:hypothetical protein